MKKTKTSVFPLVFRRECRDVADLCEINIFITPAILVQYCAGGKIKKNEMGWACGAYGGGERCAQGFGGEA
jgi:hypothetical protein